MRRLGTAKFEYCLPLKTTTDPKNSAIDLYGKNKIEESRGGNNNSNKQKLSTLTPFTDSEVYFATCSPRKNKTMKRHYNVSPDGVSSLDDYSTSTTLLCETNQPGRRMSITLSAGLMSDENSSDVSSELRVNTESLETSSQITQSTNFSHTNVSPLPSPTTSGLSMATTASCK